MTAETPAIQRNRSPIDIWTAVHLATGAVAARLGLSLPITMIAGAIYELAEPTFAFEVFGRGYTEDTYPPETCANQIMDLVALGAGWTLSAGSV